MDCLTKEKKDKKIVIWTLDGSPKFYQIEFNQIEISSNYFLKIIWNRPIKNITNNMISISFSHSNVFFEEKTISTNQFIIQSSEILNDIFLNINKKLLLQGMTIEKVYPHKKINKYTKKIIKYINKKQSNKSTVQYRT